MHLKQSTLESPLGDLIVMFEKNTIFGLDFAHNATRLNDLMTRYWGFTDILEANAPETITKAIHRYFEGDKNAFNTLKTALNGTEFQMAIWQAIRNVPWGETRSYGQLAKEIKRPKAVRAVGAANGANPIALIHACHRIIGADGTLTGYAGGLDKKKWLLAHERGL